jgi:hypothetical protein
VHSESNRRTQARVAPRPGIDSCRQPKPWAEAADVSTTTIVLFALMPFVVFGLIYGIVKALTAKDQREQNPFDQ